MIFSDPTGHNFLSDLWNDFVDAYSFSYSLEVSNAEKLVNTSNAVKSNIEVTAGFGQGVYLEADLLGVGASLGGYANYFELNYADSQFTERQRLHASYGLDFIVFGLGKEVEDLVVDGVHYVGEPTPFFTVLGINKDGEISLIGLACYAGYMGFSFDVSLDLVGFYNDVKVMEG